MADMPHLDPLWDDQKGLPDDKQIMWSKEAITRSTSHCMLLEALGQSCHDCITHRSICRDLLVITDNITHGTTSFVQPGHARLMYE